ncbi:4,5-DOPA dioxygenase extradiol [Limnohabitans sp.]|uniref:4,5-DOPA-extradiol-dioxygenase n=1 Tax=Limnohabitans sp. TaxID=1907725 RepID=UPI0038BA06E4
MTTSPSNTTTTARMPVLFVGHGSPMNAIEDSPFRREWQRIGRLFGSQWPKPQLILCISAHWITQGWQLTGMAQPKTIHDFGGFPQELFEQQYPAPGAPEWAAQKAQQWRQPANGEPLGVDLTQWGLDHGCWSVLKPMFPAADIPVVQLSMDYSRPMAEHYALGQQLRSLRHQGVLVMASGNTVHNLRTMQRSAADDQAYDWVVAFDQWVAAQISAGHNQALVDFQAQGQTAQMSHPSYDHFLPLLYAAGAAEPGDSVTFFNEGYQLASIAMRSVIWD